MFNNNQRKGLKAWVRFDGNKNAVAGSLIFQKDKPKVGNWKEYMDVNLCCSSTPSSCNTSNLNIEQLLGGLNGCYEQVVSLIPNAVYFTDYGDGTSIDNGCYDMYDNGNAFNTSLTQKYDAARESNVDFNLSIPYTHTQDSGSGDPCDYTNPPMDGQIVSGTGYFNTATCSKYFTNMYPGMFVLAATGMNVTQFGIYGNLGSDGDAIDRDDQQLTDYPGWSVFLKTNNDDNGTGDPNLIHVILLYGDLENTAHAFDANGAYDDDAIVGLGPTNTAVITLVFAKENGTGVIDIDTAVDIANLVLGLATNGCTTTTTTTAVPSFSYFANYSTTSGAEACYQAQDQFYIYSAVPIGNGVYVFTNDTLTTPAPDGYYSVGGETYHVTGGVIDAQGTCPAASAYNYVINIADLANATGNTDTNLNGKVFALTADDGSGNATSRTFTAAGIYNHWLCSADPIVPTFGYYAANAFITVGLVSTQTNSGPC